MKKLLAVLLTTAMVLTLSMSTLAQESTVTYEMAGSYTVTIPETIVVGQIDNNVPITATTNLPVGQILRIKLANGMENENGDIVLKNGFTNSAITRFYYGDVQTEITTSNNTVAEFVNQNIEATDANRALKVRGIDPAGKAAGTYSKTVEFTVSLDAAD